MLSTIVNGPNWWITFFDEDHIGRHVDDAYDWMEQQKNVDDEAPPPTSKKQATCKVLTACRKILKHMRTQWLKSYTNCRANVVRHMYQHLFYIVDKIKQYSTPSVENARKFGYELKLTIGDRAEFNPGSFSASGQKIWDIPRAETTDVPESDHTNDKHLQALIANFPCLTVTTKFKRKVVSSKLCPDDDMDKNEVAENDAEKRLRVSASETIRLHEVARILLVETFGCAE